MIAIVDYGVGNIKAFVNIYKSFNVPCVVASSKANLEGISKLILPGVGSFDHAMLSLQNSGMKEALDELVLEKEVPVLGICVGMQMLAKSSEEGARPGLGWIDGIVKGFNSSTIKGNPLPHMGWNSLDVAQDSYLFEGLDSVPRFYFLHSYYFDCNSSADVLATASYGDRFACVVNYKNIYGIQCHPEKSHHNGAKLLRNFGEL